MTRPVAFWDTSAIVPLCARQNSTSAAITLHKRYSMVVWWATPVELASALARLLRMGALSPAEWNQARTLADEIADSWFTIQPSAMVRDDATQLVERLDLRAADAFQLSAALMWCNNLPKNRFFLTIDGKLRDAALLSGFNAPTL